MDFPGHEPDLCGEKPATNRLRYGTATTYSQSVHKQEKEEIK
jgi:hypothetical protein